MLCLLCVSFKDILLNFLFFELSDSLPDVVLLRALEASLDYIHLLLLGLFDTDQSSIHLVLRHNVSGLTQVHRLLFNLKVVK